MLRLLLMAALLTLAACSRDYRPEPQATGEQIFQAACAECHKPANNGSLFSLTTEKDNLAYLNQKISQGSWLMPAFKQFSSDGLTKIST
ncbi:MAG: c-type cytochrome [Methylomonas sp.]